MLIPCESDADACFQEIRLINNFRVLGFELINQTGGGDGLGTKAALAAAKASGTQLGGRRVSLERWAEIRSGASLARMRQSEKRAADLLPAIRSIEAEGAKSLRQIAAGLNERNIVTPRGATGALSKCREYRMLLVGIGFTRQIPARRALPF